MEAIGDRLREARMRQKIDIAQVEAATKIRARYLRALENEDFGMLPGPTFVKTFLRTYADYLGLDAQLLVEEYRARYEPRSGQPFIPAAPRREPRHRRVRAPSGPAGPGTAVIVAVAVVLVIFAILGLTGGGSGGGGSSTQSASRARPHPAPPRRPSHRPARVPTLVTLRVRPDGATYVCVDHGHGTRPSFEGIVSRSMVFHGRHVRINSGKASVGLIANGRRVAIPPSSQPVGYDFTPRRTTPLPPLERPCIK